MSVNAVSSIPNNHEHLPAAYDTVIQAANMASRKKMEHLTSSTTLSQLNVANMKLHGREDDMKLLRKKLQEFTKAKVKDGKSESSKHELLLMSGISGTGKSALVKRGLEEPAQKMGIAFAGGKFDLNKSSALPLSAFSDAMSSLITHAAGSKHADAIKDDVKNAFKRRDMIRLIDAMPGCGDLLSSFLTEEEDNGDEESRHSLSTVGDDERGGISSFSGGKEAVQRLQYSTRVLLKAICTHLKGVVIFIDDFQWSDVATIQLLKSLLVSNDIPSLLLVGAYREDEVSETHPLMRQLKDGDEDFHISTIKIGNLSSDNAKSLVAEALRMEDNENAVGNLANTIYKKTDGNAFYVLIFLKSLYEEQLLKYNFGGMKWVWDDEAVDRKLVTANVATILINKLKRFDEITQLALQVAACHGARFSVSSVAMVVGGLSSNEVAPASEDAESTESKVSRLINGLVDEGLLENESDSHIHRRFSHDQIQSAAFELIPSEKKDSFRGQIGDLLMKKLKSEELEEQLFEVVSLRNYDMASMSEGERYDLARMNLKAGLKASRNAAFDTSVGFFCTGRKLLGANAWDVDGDTMLQLCSEEANACYINGDIPTMKMLIDEVLIQDISIEEKFKAYEIKILALRARTQFNEAVDVAIEVRRQLKLHTPANKPTSTLVILQQYFKTQRALGKKSPEELAGLPKLESERISMGQRMLELFLSSAYQCQPTIFPLGVFLMVRTSIKHGISASSCDAFATYGILLAGLFGKANRGRDMARAAELLLENPDYGRMQSRTIFVCESGVYHWTAPLHGTLAPLLSGYKNGLEIGDIESASINLLTRSIHLWYSSRPLDGVLHELQTNYDVLVTQLKQSAEGADVLPFLIAAKKLRGDVCNVDFDDINVSEKKSRAATTTITKIELCVISQDWDSAFNLLQGAGNLRKHILGTYAGVRFAFLEGLIYLKAAQHTSESWLLRNKHKKKATKSIKLIRGLLKSGNVNVVHALHLLSAEHAVLNGNKSAAENQFKLAISVASQNGFLQDRGLSHELAARYYTTQGDTYWVRYHLEQAELSFTDWGATSKVEQLREQKRALIGEI